MNNPMIRTSTLLTCFCIVLLTSINIQAATITSTSAGGDWNMLATWQGGIVPTLADDVIIQSGSNVTISSMNGSYNAQCKSLSVNGTLNHASNNVLIGGGDGGNAPFIINGTLNLSGGYNFSFVVNGFMKFNTGSTFNMPFGSIILNGNDGTAPGSVQAGQAILDVTDISTLNLTNGTIYILNPHFVSGEPCIKGAKTFGATISLGNNNPPKTPTDYIVSNTHQPIFNNLEVNYNAANGSKARLSTIVVKGVFGVNNGHFINASGSEKIFVGGDMTIGDNGVVEGDIEFNGAFQQNINAIGTNTSILFKGNLIANTGFRVKMKLNVEIPSPYTLRLENGLFDVGSHTLTLNEPVTVTNPSSTKFITTHDLYSEVGILKIKNRNSATLYPVGYELGAGSPHYTPVTITPSVSSDFSVSVYPKNSVVALDSIRNVWDISRNNAASADIVFQWNTDDEQGNFGSYRNNCRVYHYNGSTWDAITGNGANTSGSIHTKTATNVSTFSPFTVLTSATLPVSLTEFKAKAVGKNAVLTWSTATEINNSGFDIEKSLDGINFSKIDFVKGNGNSNVLLSYISVDNDFSQSAFYRLKQIDFDGKIEYSRIVQLEKSKSGTIKMYPNPIINNATLNIEITSEISDVVDVSVMDISGRVIYKNKYEATSNAISVPTQDLARGLYLVKVQNGLNISIQKIVKE
jgi:Secretion system C-terminal sorting domain